MPVRLDDVEVEVLLDDEDKLEEETEVTEIVDVEELDELDFEVVVNVKDELVVDEEVVVVDEEVVEVVFSHIPNLEQVP